MRVLFPVHLFPGRSPKDSVLVEDSGFFKGPTGDFDIHAGRLIWMRMVCVAFAREHRIRHVRLEDADEFLADLAKDKKNKKVVVYDPVDNFVLARWSDSLGDRLVVEPNPGFVLPGTFGVESVPKTLRSAIDSVLAEPGTDSTIPSRRSALKRLEEIRDMESTDESNRERPDDRLRDLTPKPPDVSARKKDYRAALEWVQENFPDAPGDPEAALLFPATRKAALKELRSFVENRLEHFGKYQDAVLTSDDKDPRMMHSGLSACMNVGLVGPAEAVLVACARVDKVPDNSLEAYVRQVLGWREYMRQLYAEEGKSIEKTRYTKLSTTWYDRLSTTLSPLAYAIRRAERYAYLDHISRLMIVNSLAVLSEAPIGGVIRWFTELCAIDAHQWVMVSNISHMQGLAGKSRRPYVSSSAYLRRMTDLEPGDWEDAWDALFYRWVLRERDDAARFYSRSLTGKRYTSKETYWKRLADKTLNDL